MKGRRPDLLCHEMTCYSAWVVGALPESVHPSERGYPVSAGTSVRDVILPKGLLLFHVVAREDDYE